MLSITKHSNPNSLSWDAVLFGSSVSKPLTSYSVEKAQKQSSKKFYLETVIETERSSGLLELEHPGATGSVWSFLLMSL